MNVWEFVGSYWWLVFPLGGVIGGAASGWAKAVRRWDERRRQHKLELYKIKYGNRVGPAPEPPAVAAEQRSAAAEAGRPRSGEIERLLADHEDVNTRWLDYELDVAKLIDFPLMSDMREPVTVDFHRAKRHADGLRPDEGERLDPDALSDYRQAVRDFQVAFDVAEREAKRRRAFDFTVEERRTLDRAKRLIALAEDSGATHAERQQAYRRAQHELQGLIAIPDAANEALEHRIAGALGSSEARSPVTPPRD